jgi:hypothetical protein
MLTKERGEASDNAEGTTGYLVERRETKESVPVVPPKHD